MYLQTKRAKQKIIPYITCYGALSPRLPNSEIQWLRVITNKVKKRLVFSHFSQCPPRPLNPLQQLQPAAGISRSIQTLSKHLELMRIGTCRNMNTNLSSVP